MIMYISIQLQHYKESVYVIKEFYRIYCSNDYTYIAYYKSKTRI